MLRCSCRGGVEGRGGRECVATREGPLLSGSPPHTGPTCGGHSSEVVSPAEHHPGPAAGALHQCPGQGGEEKDHSQVQHGHEEWKVEALWGPKQIAGVERCHMDPTSLPYGGMGPFYCIPSPLVTGANPVLCVTPWNKWLVPTVEVTQRSGSPGTHSLPSFITTTPASHLLSPPGTGVQEKPP